MMNGGGLPLGLFPDAEPATQELTLDAGDVLFLYTDGVAQARGPDNTYFQDRLADELAGLAGRPPTSWSRRCAGPCSTSARATWSTT